MIRSRRYTVERQLRLIGDVADPISPRFWDKHPEINWIIVTDLRHMIEHQYGDTLTKRLWLTAIN